MPLFAISSMFALLGITKKANKEVFFERVVRSIPNVIHLCYHNRLENDDEKLLLGLRKLLFLTLSK